MSEIRLMELFVHFVNGILSGIYAGRFLIPKRFSTRVTLMIWPVAYTAAQLLLGRLADEFFPYNSFVSAMPCLLSVLALGAFLYSREGARLLFVALSFTAGWEILRFVASPLAHVLYGLWGPVMTWIVNQDFILSSVGADEAIHMIDFVSRAVNVMILTVCRAAQEALLALYLHMITRSFAGRYDVPLRPAESLFLILPCLTVLVIDFTVRLMAVSVDNGAATLIYSRVPVTALLLPLGSVMLLGMIVSASFLFQNLTQYKEEEQKRFLLESGVLSLRREIEELQDIYADIRGLRHDIRGHIAHLAACVRARGADGGEVAEFISAMEKTVGRLDFPDETGSAIIDVIVSQARQRAERTGISFEAAFHCPGEFAIDVYDIGVILHNALQNATEAASKVEGKRSISLRSYVKGGLFFIEAENDFTGALTLDEATGLPITTKGGSGQGVPRHGLGLANIERCAKKYNGGLDISVSGDGPRPRFQLTVMMCGRKMEER